MVTSESGGAVKRQRVQRSSHFVESSEENIIGSMSYGIGFSLGLRYENMMQFDLRLLCEVC